MSLLRRSFEAALVVLLLSIYPIAAHSQSCVTNSQVTLTGNLRGANGIPSSNYTMTLAPSQQGYIAGCGVNLATQVACGTSTDGSVVGIPNPLTATINTASGSGSLGSGVYYTVYEWYDAAGHVTLPSPETATTLSTTGSLVVNPPSSGIPSNAVGMDVFIGTTSGGETLQGQTTGTASYVQASALISGASPSSSNTTLCQVTANDAVWPTGTGYQVSLTDSSGNPVPGYPMQWQLIGPGTTINLSNGLPYYHGVVYYPVPILSAPANHGIQSISGPLSLGGYNLTQVGKLGVGTATPGWGIDNENAGANGVINTKTGYLLNGGAGTIGQALCSDGTYLDNFCTFLTTLGSIYYQTVQVSSTSKPQEAKLNLIPGTNSGVACVDDPGLNSTDCTLSNTAVVGPNANVPTITGAGVLNTFAGFNDGAGLVQVNTTTPRFTLAFGGTYPHPMACSANSSDPNDAYPVYVSPLNYAITGYSIVSNVVTFTGATGAFTGLTAATTVQILNFPTSTFLNGQTMVVLSSGLSTTQFEATFAHANASASEAGFAFPYLPYIVTIGMTSTPSSSVILSYQCHQ